MWKDLVGGIIAFKTACALIKDTACNALMVCWYDGGKHKLICVCYTILQVRTRRNAVDANKCALIINAKSI